MAGTQVASTATEGSPVARLKSAINMPSVQEQFQNALHDSAPLFVASLIDVYSSDTNLQQCEPRAVIMEALKAATLRLPINRNLGFAWIIPRWSTKENRYVPGFQTGWKGIVQLAQRTGAYRYINADAIYDGETVEVDRITGDATIKGQKASDTAIGYFAYIELLNGFRKVSFWTKEQVEAHAIKYNPECKKAGKLVNNWKDYFDSRAKSTVLKNLISKYGIMSVEMANVINDDEDHDYESAIRQEIAQKANGSVIDIKTGVGEDAGAATTTAAQGQEGESPDLTGEDKERSLQLDKDLAEQDQRGKQPGKKGPGF